MKGKIMDRKIILVGIGLAALYWTFESAVMTLIFQGDNFVVEMLTPNPHEIWTRLLVMIAIALGVYAQFTRTERKQAEKALHDNKTELTTILNHVPLVLFVVDRDFYIRKLNRTAAEFADRTVEEAIGVRSGEALRCLYHLDDPRGCGFGPSCQKCGIRLTVADTLRTGDSYYQANASFSFRYGEKEVELAILVSAALLSISNEEMVLVCIEDITENKRMEEQLRHSQLLASLGEMTAGITHEVGNPLASILLYSEAALKGDVSGQTRKDLKVIQNEAKRAGKLMRDLLAYSRKLEPQMRRLNPYKILKKVLDMRRYEERVQNINVSANLLDGPLYVKGDSSQLTQVFMNLIINAEEAIKESKGKNIEITSWIDGEWAKVSIADDGIGIPEENLSQVFHPFFTTKKIGEGTGLGLSTCYGIITAHGGLIYAENNKMGGVTFTVQLPLTGMGRQGILPLEIKEASS